ncbi:MAG TPA: XdhC/CoxI family protein [Syntrophomonas sp.]|nr:XdhC/CoxI family protein [Syntrophomonas sp.]
MSLTNKQCDFPVILDLLRQGEELVLLTVISREGSTPRLPGSRMVLSGNGILAGTIGGGIVEAQALDTARKTLQDKINRILYFSSLDNGLATVDMICGGSLHILLEFLGRNHYNLELFQWIKQCHEQRKKLYIFTPLPDHRGHSEPKFCLGEDGTVYGQPAFTEIPDLVRETDWTKNQVIHMNGKEYMVEFYPPEETLYIFGAGHVAVEVCSLAVYLGFEVLVLDDRREYLNRERFPAAHQLIFTQSFEDCFQELKIDDNSMLLIVTRGHRHDAEVLEQALHTDAFYIGMIGSKNKRDTLYRNLVMKGYDREGLEQVNCPVGIAIGADTPEEIAISISAQLIQARAEKRRRNDRCV